MMLKWNAYLPVVAMFLAATSSGCARRVVDWDARLGECTDRRVGYYSYLSGLPARTAEEICVVVASRAGIERQRLFESDSVHIMYPTVLFDAARTYVLPADLGFLSKTCDQSGFVPADTIEVGYFANKIGARFGYEKGPIPGGPKGLTWAHINPKANDDLKNAVSGMLERAAAEGADAIVDLSVYWSSAPDVFGDRGLYMRGRAVAYGTVRDIGPEVSN